MIAYLLDINVTIALIDPVHSHHDLAHAWFESEGHRAWATCPLTENGVLRIVGHSSYRNSPGSPTAVAALLVKLRRLAGHRFWPDRISLLDSDLTRMERLLQSPQITDSYLLALAVSNSGRLATFDRRLVVDAVVGGRKALHLIE